MKKQTLNSHTFGSFYYLRQFFNDDTSFKHLGPLPVPTKKNEMLPKQKHEEYWVDLSWHIAFFRLKIYFQREFEEEKKQKCCTLCLSASGIVTTVLTNRALKLGPFQHETLIVFSVICCFILNII
jgi:hypothetical protein